jgi:hypothetical protein
MLRIVFLLFVGIVIGYFIGFSDAQKYDENIVKRVVARVGGAAARSGVSNDIDRKYDKVGK